ncbi:MAG: hypothetical protein U0235_28700 [Polyangiaceae bacterium]
MNILFAAELARRLEGTRVTSNSLHPGTVASNFGLDSGFWIKLFYRWFRMFLTDEAKGARTTVHVASAPEVAEVTGKHFASCKVGRRAEPRATPRPLAGCGSSRVS